MENAGLECAGWIRSHQTVAYFSFPHFRRAARLRIMMVSALDLRSTVSEYVEFNVPLDT